jgi:hypothetical protein
VLPKAQALAEAEALIAKATWTADDRDAAMRLILSRKAG